MKVFHEKFTDDGPDADHHRVWLVGQDRLPLRTFGDAVGESTQMSRNAQIGGGAEWTKKDVRDRGNDAFVKEYSTWREFPTELARWHYLHSLTRADADKPYYPKPTLVHLRLELPGGAWVDERITRPLVACVAADPVGSVGLRLRWRITGGQTEKTFTGNTGAYSWLIDSDGNEIIDSNGQWIGDSEHET